MNRNVKILGKSLPVLPVVIISLLTVGVVVGQTILLFREVGMSMRVMVSYNMQVLDYAEALLDSIALGDYCIGDPAVQFPSADNYWLKNTGRNPIYVSWSCSGLPLGATISVKHKLGESWFEMPEGWISTSELTQDDVYAWRFEVTIGDTAVEGDYAPTITWNAHNSI